MSVASTWSMEDNELKLGCWILNKSDCPFMISIGKDKAVDNLKEAIKEEEHAFSAIDYDTLKLWKLSSPIPSFDVGKLRNSQTLEAIGHCVELDPLTELWEHFSSPPPPRGHVHIIVQFPPNYPTEDAEVHQLRLLCERYWNRGEEGRAEIYKNCTLQVPFLARPGAEGAEEAATDAEYPATGVQEATPVVSKTTSESNEGLDEESDMSFNTNCMVSYESLSLGPDFPNFFGNGYSSILVRKEYRDMFQHISYLHKNGKHEVVVTGMPGIGKSFFLYFVLIERILNGQPTAYQSSPTRVIFMFGRRDVRVCLAHMCSDPREFPGTWALVDSCAALVQPRSGFILTHSKFHAASPDPVRWKARKDQLSADMAIMKPWSWEELYIGGTEFISPPLEALTLPDIYVKYGGSARQCYNLATSRDEVTEWERQIPHILAGMSDIALFEDSSELITIVPDQARQPCVTLVSRHIAEHFFRAVFVHDHERFWDCFNRLASVSESCTPAGWLWQLYAIRVALSTQSTKTKPISLRRLSPIESSQPPTKKTRPNPIEHPFSRVIVHGDQEALSKELSRATKSTLFIPSTRGQATFDAFSISGDNEVTLYQATIRESHSINAKRLDFVWDAIKSAEGQGSSNAKRLLPSSFRKWRVVFLIPKEAETHWKTTQDIEFGNIKPKRQWGQYVEQFVGVLPKNTTADLIPLRVVC